MDSSDTNKKKVNNAGYGLVGDTEASLPRSSIAPHSSDAEHAKARAVMYILPCPNLSCTLF